MPKGPCFDGQLGASRHLLPLLVEQPLLEVDGGGADELVRTDAVLVPHSDLKSVVR